MPILEISKLRFKKPRPLVPGHTAGGAKAAYHGPTPNCPNMAFMVLDQHPLNPHPLLPVPTHDLHIGGCILGAQAHE